MLCEQSSCDVQEHCTTMIPCFIMHQQSMINHFNWKICVGLGIIWEDLSLFLFYLPSPPALSLSLPLRASRNVKALNILLS
mmetsp:Transcript_56297/g.117656  ORF Transcript_56297/g.117656 Transcript_56297/m.117656 type:complete len:81 (-) Transcript_56297:176-418(-)